ncbi:hypothetical protein ACQ27_gp085 [Klebsiella phage K64-1]|uniref:hypothetical protein n=1 Tax=Klebsiella phage K64-1 TaxID=1439894 RepID=UPI00248AFB21|nr:hypothetical protein ACQ27_gp085 [Klebsiella phage K64-1]
MKVILTALRTSFLILLERTSPIVWFSCEIKPNDSDVNVNSLLFVNPPSLCAILMYEVLTKSPYFEVIFLL